MYLLVICSYYLFTYFQAESYYLDHTYFLIQFITFSFNTNEQPRVNEIAQCPHKALSMQAWWYELNSWNPRKKQQKWLPRKLPSDDRHMPTLLHFAYTQ